MDFAELTVNMIYLTKPTIFFAVAEVIFIKYDNVMWPAWVGEVKEGKGQAMFFAEDFM